MRLSAGGGVGGELDETTRLQVGRWGEALVFAYLTLAVNSPALAVNSPTLAVNSPPEQLNRRGLKDTVEVIWLNQVRPLLVIKHLE
jgi:hypothetical protein